MTTDEISTAPSDAPTGDVRALFEREIPTIQRIVDALSRRYGLDPDEADSFGSWVMERILDDDLAVLRKFGGRSSLRTYLSVVVANLYRDHRIRRMGRWRPSATARRLGPAGVLLDAALNRAGHTLEEAVSLVASRTDVDVDETTLRRWAAEIPRREPRRFVEATDAERVGDGVPADAALEEGERGRVRSHAEGALEKAVSRLPEQDQVILRLHFWEGLTLAAVARTLGIEQKPLYRRLERNLRTLRDLLEEAGVGADDVREVIPL